MTVTSMELKALMDWGYRSTTHPVYDQVFVPSPEFQFVEMRANYTLVDMRVTQAIENLTGELTLSTSSSASSSPPLTRPVTKLSTNGISLQVSSSLVHKRIRKTDLAVAMAIGSSQERTLQNLLSERKSLHHENRSPTGSAARQAEAIHTAQTRRNIGIAVVHLGSGVAFTYDVISTHDNSLRAWVYHSALLHTLCFAPTLRTVLASSYRFRYVKGFFFP
ncbi:uncharacterized protein EI90DRAFT_151569 [Cantharellus anzutake]|uniref:uncharacterized protein n=1 Tax=Cantharellus anzutake TaxID=1750568 RepID=UPI0019034E56|nr:uncharacterized protein EI90DRAFT_151569 [Cantharellus anzutake]KAF8336252.1 hypothetical protein EI90DRAFT_151569 [Cantharellus anzutake]